MTRLTALAILGVCACGGQQSITAPSTATVSGVVDGAPFVANGVTAVIDVGDPNAARSIVIADRAMSCSDIGHILHGRLITIEAFDREGSARPVGPGTYEIRNSPTGPQAVADYFATDAQCRIQNAIDAAPGGTVVISKAGFAIGETIAGTFDLVIGGNHVTGSFQTAVCPPPSFDHLCR